MTDLTLTIGNKNLSSWSLRPWILMKQTGIAFKEENIRLDRPETRTILAEKSPSGLVPFLTHKTDSGDVGVWDSLAIAEYLNELFPEKQLWPDDTAARAHARAVSAEMHSGFTAMRTVWPMQFLRRDLKHLTSGGVQRDIDRIANIWRECRTRFGGAGEFLFGSFSIADAMYAPVVSRFTTYGPLDLNSEAAAYIDVISALGAMKVWEAGARAEADDSA